MCSNVAVGCSSWLSCNETLMKMLGNLGWRGREREGRGIERREEEGRGKAREAPAAFPDDPWGEPQLSPSPDPPPSPSLSPPLCPLYTTIQKLLQQNDFNEDILPQLRPYPFFATQIKSLDTLLRLDVWARECFPPSPSGIAPTLSVMFMILLRGELAEAVLSVKAVNTTNEMK